MTRRALGLLVVLLLLAIKAGFYFYSHDRRAETAVSAVANARPNLKEELAEIREADKTDDVLQRCLHYPNPREFKWDNALTAAVCNLLQRRMMSFDAIKAALKSKNPEILETEFQKYLDETFKDGHHGYLIWTYWWMFQNPSKNTEEVTEQWVAESPKSAFAYTARGMHFIAAAYDVRGKKFAKETPQENFDRMHDFVAKARSDLEQALSINPRMIAAYHGLMSIARLSGDQDTAESIAQKALALDPLDQWIYDDWIDAADPKWGGSLAQVQHIGELAAAHAAENPLLGRSRAAYFTMQSERMDCHDCGVPQGAAKALDLYRKAGEFGPSGYFLNHAGAEASRSGDYATAVIYYSQTIRFFNSNDAYIRRAQALYQIGEKQWAQEQIARFVRDHPDNTLALGEQAYMLSADGRAEEAERVYRSLRDIDPKNEDAGLHLSYLYLGPLKTPDKAAPILDDLLAGNPKLARAYLYKAVLAKGKSEEACRDALIAYLKFVDRNDAGEAKDIAGAEARLREMHLDPKKG